MKFKVGDKVRVRKDLKQGIYGNINYISCMDEYKDKIATITEILEFNNCYMLDIDRNAYYWSGEMLEPIESGEKVAKSSEKVAKDIIEYQGKKYDVLGKCIYNSVIYGDNTLGLDLKEHKEEILDDIEKEYLGNVIKYVIEPTKNKIKSITKIKTEDMIDVFFNDNKVHKNQYHKIKKFYIRIIFENGEELPIPTFEDKRMYKGMVDNQPYTLEELGL